MKNGCSANSSLVLIFRPALWWCVALSGCVGLQVDLRPLDNQRQGPETPLEIAWSYNARAGFGPDSPQSYRGYILVSTRQGEVHLIEDATGKRIGSKRFGDVIDGAPAVVGDILVVPVAAGRSALVGYDLTRAQVLWRNRGAPIFAGLVKVDEDVIMANIDGLIARVQASDGGQVWSFALPDSSRIHARPIVASGQVVVADDTGRVFALGVEDGEIRWEKSVGAPVYETPTVDDGRLFVPTTRGSMDVLDAITGELLWQAALPDSIVRFTSVEIDGPVAFAGTSNGQVFAWDVSAGKERWVFDAPAAVAAPPLATGDVVYVGSMGQRLYALRRADGKLVQEIELRGRIKSALELHSDALIVLTEPRNVVRLIGAVGDE